MNPFSCLACDLGAESGRVMLGTLSDKALRVEEVHRFPNTPVQRDGRLEWDIPALFSGLKAGLSKAAARGQPIAGISADSWGVDYIFFDNQGAMLPPVFHYRDPRTAEGVRKVWEKTDWKSVFAETGIQFMAINTLFQLAAESPERISRAWRILNIADGFNYLLSGVARAEQSLASTTQLYNPRSRSWSHSLLKLIGARPELFPVVVSSGTRLGPLRPEIATETGLRNVDVFATCSHDTGAAVAAVPAAGTDWAFLSSGTWSLLGVEIPDPILTDACRDLGFTNEIGFGGRVRLLKNIIGLWLVQECRRDWAKTGQEYDYESLTQLCASSRGFVSLIDPADSRFPAPGAMPEKIAAFCRETGQPAPADPGACVRCILESLALFYRRTLEQLELLLGRKIRRLHVVGGGSKNRVLNQFVANALHRQVLAGPAEASAFGNVLIQAIASGVLPSLEAARGVVRSSVALETFEPREEDSWDRAYGIFQKLVG
jgi:rhamnulokinase